MEISNQNSTNFGSRFLIREFPEGKEYVSASGKASSMIFTYVTDSLTLTERNLNKKENKMIIELINTVISKFSKTHRIKTENRGNMNTLLTEHIIDVEDSLDDFVEQGIDKIAEHREKNIYKVSSNIKKLSHAKFEDHEKILARFRKED